MRLKEEAQCRACVAMFVGLQAASIELLRPVAPCEWALDQAFQPRYNSLHGHKNWHKLYFRGGSPTYLRCEAPEKIFAGFYKGLEANFMRE